MSRLPEILGYASFDYVLPLEKAAALYHLDADTYYSLCDSIIVQNRYDFIVLEHPAFLSRPVLSRLSNTSQLFLVSGQDKESLQRLLQFFSSVGNLQGRCNIICGKYREDMTDALSESAVAEACPICARIPLLDHAPSLSDLEKGQWFSSVPSLLGAS